MNVELLHTMKMLSKQIAFLLWPIKCKYQPLRMIYDAALGIVESMHAKVHFLKK